MNLLGFLTFLIPHELAAKQELSHRGRKKPRTSRGLIRPDPLPVQAATQKQANF